VDARLLWLLWLIPLACGALTYAGLRGGWPFWLLLLSSAGYALPLWLGVFALAYLRGSRHPLALAPFAAAFLVAALVSPVLHVRITGLEETGGLRLTQSIRYPFTYGMAATFLGGTAFVWLAGIVADRLAGALLALSLALLLVFLVFERSQKKSDAGIDPDASKGV